MTIDNPEEFATFLYNQQQKQNLLNQDIHIQKEGIDHEIGQWQQVLSIGRQTGVTEKIEAIKQEINGLQLDQQNCTQVTQHLTTINTVIDEMKALPEIKEPFSRIEAAQETLNTWRLPE